MYDQYGHESGEQMHQSTNGMHGFSGFQRGWFWSLRAHRPYCFLGNGVHEVSPEELFNMFLNKFMRSLWSGS